MEWGKYRTGPSCSFISLATRGVPISRSYRYCCFVFDDCLVPVFFAGPLFDLFELLDVFFPFLLFLERELFRFLFILRGSGLNSSRMLFRRTAVSSRLGSAFLAASRISFASLIRPVFIYSRPRAFRERA